jgi:hypothetical protein
MLKTIIIVVILVIVMGVAVQMRGTDTVYVKENTVEVKAELKEAWETDEDAIKAAQAVIRKKELQAELTGLKEVQASTTERIKTLEKELGTY